ncbi:MAG: glycoside hydrolase family 3 N-terminal domain-containing protein [Prevotellaceae bacterium]|nr:glycoside hydrolase family 3 N-terminal domain-containing protein [Prevotellaceae bacterium]
MRALFSIVVAFLCVACPASNTKHMEQCVNQLYNRMSRAERVAQLRSMYMSKLFTPAGVLDETKCRELIPNGIGHIPQFAMDMGLSPNEQRDRVAQLQAWLMANTPNGIPALVHEEALTGVNALDATVYPQQIGLACSFNTALAEKKTQLTATALRSMGGLLALSPMVDVVRNPSFNRLEESYGEDGYLSAAMGVAFVKGLQHKGNLRTGVAACTKHFLGYGGGGDAPEKELMEDILLPHEAIMRKADSQVLMTGYHAMKGVKCVANKWLQQDLLRNYLGFDGLTVSDYGSIPQIGDTLSPLQRCVAAMNAGNEVDFPNGDTYAHLPEALEKGLVSEQALEKAVKHVLMLKAKLGLLDKNPVLYSKRYIQFDTKQARQLSYELATQSVVLLKNDTLQGVNEALLPLSETKLTALGGRVFLTGPNANSMWALAGDYTFQAMRYFWVHKDEGAMRPKYVFLKEGMEAKMPRGGVLSYARGCEWTDEPETIMEQGGDPRVAQQRIIDQRMVRSNEPAHWDDALALAQQSDVIVAAMGENVMLSGENRDRTKLTLPGRQEEYVRSLLATGKPVVLVVFGGRAQVLGDLAAQCKAVIQAWYPGEEGGNAVTDILYGHVSPSGKLSVSYPAVETHDALCYSYGVQDDARVAWPFGYGLSYASFAYSNMRMPAEVATTDASFTLSVDIKNTGGVRADEVVQLYVSPLDNPSQLKPIQLQGFARVSLKPGKKQTLKFRLYPEQLGYYADGQWNIAPGRYQVMVAASSKDIRQVRELRLTGKHHTQPLRQHYLSEVIK